MNYPAAELRSIKMNFYLLNPDAEHRGILLIKSVFILEGSEKKCPLSIGKQRRMNFLNLNIDEIVKSHFTDWIPAFVGMTDSVSD